MANHQFLDEAQPVSILLTLERREQLRAVRAQASASAWVRGAIAVANAQPKVAKLIQRAVDDERRD